MKFNLDTGAAVTVFSLDIAENRPEQTRHSKCHITAPGERTQDFEGAVLNCIDELNVNRSITG